jgi:hypothetical protein
MHYNDHDPPHFQARYGEWEAVIAISTGAVLDGNLPSRVAAPVEERRLLHRAERDDDWNRARSGTALHSIAPLE